jgi:ribosomal-protein-alanine N-acetyltransferase
MLQGRLIQLRPLREADLDAMYAAHTNISDRGPHFPLGVLSEPAFRREFAENGFWQQDEGTLLIVTTEDGELVGHIEFFRAVSYWDALRSSSRTSFMVSASPVAVMRRRPSSCWWTTCSPPSRGIAFTW